MAKLAANLAFDFRTFDLYKNYETAYFFPSDTDPSHIFFAYPSNNTAITVQGKRFEYLPNGVPFEGTTEAVLSYVKSSNQDYKHAHSLADISVNIEETSAYLQKSPGEVAAEIFKGNDEFYGSKFDDHLNGYKGKN